MEQCTQQGSNYYIGEPPDIKISASAREPHEPLAIASKIYQNEYKSLKTTLAMVRGHDAGTFMGSDVFGDDPGEYPNVIS